MISVKNNTSIAWGWNNSSSTIQTYASDALACSPRASRVRALLSPTRLPEVMGARMLECAKRGDVNDIICMTKKCLGLPNAAEDPSTQYNHGTITFQTIRVKHGPQTVSCACVHLLDYTQRGGMQTNNTNIIGIIELPMKILDSLPHHFSSSRSRPSAISSRGSKIDLCTQDSTGVPPFVIFHQNKMVFVQYSASLVTMSDSLVCRASGWHLWVPERQPDIGMHCLGLRLIGWPCRMAGHLRFASDHDNRLEQWPRYHLYKSETPGQVA